MTRFVLDASAALPWCFRDEETDYTRALQAELADAEIVVPPIWPSEIVNALVMAERRGRIDAADIRRFLADLESIDLVIEGGGIDHAFRHALPLAQRYGKLKLTAYDAAYLDLASRLGIPLATLDAVLIRAAAAEGVPLFRPQATGG